MTSDYKKYYYYSHLDHNMEVLGVCVTDNIGNAANYFAAMKKLDAKEFLKIYSISFYNEHK
jgi:hypothetical protein